MPFLLKRKKKPKENTYTWKRQRQSLDDLEMGGTLTVVSNLWSQGLLGTSVDFFASIITCKKLIVSLNGIGRDTYRLWWALGVLCRARGTTTLCDWMLFHLERYSVLVVLLSSREWCLEYSTSYLSAAFVSSSSCQQITFVPILKTSRTLCQTFSSETEGEEDG